MHVLRKSFGAYSAGTPLHQVIEGVWYVGHTMNTVPNDLVTKRRDRIVMRPNNSSSRDRRREKRGQGNDN